MKTFPNLLMKFASILVVLLSNFTVDATPTERHIQTHSLEEILENSPNVVKDNISQLLEIASLETEDTFFGYHALSTKSRLFQDVLRAVFEECLEIELPENFYFLRIPGEKDWSWEQGKQTFQDDFAEHPFSEEHQKLIVIDFLTYLSKENRIVLTYDDLSNSEVKTVWKFFQNYLKKSEWDEWNSNVKKYSLDFQYVMDSKFDVNSAELTNIICKKNKSIDLKLNSEVIASWISKTLSNDFEVVRILTLNHLDVDHHHYYQIYYNTIDPILDSRYPFQALLVALNVSILGNFMTSGCYTAEILYKNESVLNGDKNLKQDLEKYFETIGLDSNLVEFLWKEGKIILNENNVTSGCLLQFFDDSVNTGNDSFNFLNNNAYVSFKRGVPVFKLNPAVYVLGDFYNKNSKDLELRLIMNNQTTLNPFSSLRMIRHDQLSSAQSKEIIARMKMHLKNNVQNKQQLNQYKECLEQIWKVSVQKCGNFS